MTHILPLGRAAAYPRHYDSSLLFPIARALGREALGLTSYALPFAGHDRWHAYELGWLDPRGKPVTATATLTVPASSPNLIESKSLKFYLNSLNATHFDDGAAVRARIAADLSHVAGAPVDVAFGLPSIGDDASLLIDALDIAIDDYGPPDPAHLRSVAVDRAEEILRSDLLKSNCPVTGQPDWASVRIGYLGPRMNREGLLRYLVSFRDHADFHEQCVERIFTDLLTHCRPDTLSVEARYTRRGGLDINPVRMTHDHAAHVAGRDERQ